ncbi:MAG: hypothetical protein JWM99_4362, partial [Verrucomicrobiales bacterium]|nr:hypothetical protein [Verrucomicrobiales bacterium]
MRTEGHTNHRLEAGVDCLIRKTRRKTFDLAAERDPRINHR